MDNSEDFFKRYAKRYLSSPEYKGRLEKREEDIQFENLLYPANFREGDRVVVVPTDKFAEKYAGKSGIVGREELVKVGSTQYTIYQVYLDDGSKAMLKASQLDLVKGK